MNSKAFKIVFGEIANANGFETAFGGWFKESTDTIIVLDLQKSNFGDYYELNIKIYVQGIFDNKYNKHKDLVKKEPGDIFRRQPPEYKEAFNLDVPMEPDKRKKIIDNLFHQFIVPFSNKALTRSGLKYLESKGDIYLLPAVKFELEKE
jgi:hypothetical protein